MKHIKCCRYVGMYVPKSGAVMAKDKTAACFVNSLAYAVSGCSHVDRIKTLIGYVTSYVYLYSLPPE